MKLVFVKAVTEVQIDPVSAAVKLIESERQKVPYNSKEKWLCFDVQATTIDVLEQLVFLKAVRSRLVAKNRKEYGASRNLDTQLVSDENGVPVLYVHSERY
jgi:hypothetical protein